MFRIIILATLLALTGIAYALLKHAPDACEKNGAGMSCEELDKLEIY